MCLWGFLTGRYGASAKVADSRLILSMPDAETPVVWIMDLNDAATAVLRLETDRQNLSVIKKYGGKGAAETVAVYRSRKKAERALAKASRALEKARESRLHVGPNAQPVIVRQASLIGRIFTLFLYIWVAAQLTMMMYGYLSYYVAEPMPDVAKMVRQQKHEPSTQQQQAPAPAASQDMSGVPMSADEFLKQQSQKLILP